MTSVDQSGPRALDRDAALPLWAQLHADLRRRTENAEFTAVFPGEFALVAEYGVSRHTVREALRRLRADGVVVAARGRPSRVATEIEQPLGRLYSLFTAVEHVGQRQRSVVRALEIRTDDVAAGHLALPSQTPLLYLERLRLADEEPFAIDQVWLPAEQTTALLSADFTHTALYQELEERCGIWLTDGREHIRAVAPTPAEVATLLLPEGVAVFAIDRFADHNGRPTEWRHTVVRGDRFTLTAQFSARTGYQLDVGDPAG